MRDIALTVLMAILLIRILQYPWIGVLVYAWMSIFQAHKWTFGFAADFPWAMIIAAVTVMSMFLHPKEVRFPKTSITALLVILPLWMTFTTMFALEPADAWFQWKNVMKVFIFAIITGSLIHTRKHIECLVWVLVGSVGFYAVKGGLFTLNIGGGQKVYGPPGTSFISDNNAISVAIIMVIPLMYYLASTLYFKRAWLTKWLRLGMYGAMGLGGIAVLGSQSRGAFLGIAAMVTFLWLKSEKKIPMGIAFAVLIPLAVGFMPDTWTKRMESTKTYEEDSSAMGRINAWTMAYNLANDRILVGGGFEPYTATTFARYAPNPTDVHTAHSIYFQMLGEHGWIGLALFLLLGAVGWIKARAIVRASRKRPDCAWASILAKSIQVSLVGYAVGGAFVNISYWDMPYYELVLLMATQLLVTTVPAREENSRIVQKSKLAVT